MSEPEKAASRIKMLESMTLPQIKGLAITLSIKVGVLSEEKKALCEALEDCMPWMSRENSNACKEAWSKAKSALAKARGEAQE